MGQAGITGRAKKLGHQRRLVGRSGQKLLNRGVDLLEGSRALNERAQQLLKFGHRDDPSRGLLGRLLDRIDAPQGLRGMKVVARTRQPGRRGRLA